jgi:small subunit ribosomal protein S1
VFLKYCWGGVVMLSKKISENEGDEVPDLDEGWWASVLADEEAYANSPRAAANKVPAPALITVDWDNVQILFEKDEVVTLQVYGFNRGGVLVQGENLQGFVPISHLVDMPCNAQEEERRQILNEYVGRLLDLKVIECEPTQERIVLSERAALAGQGRRKQLFNTLRPGEVVHGAVTNVTDFGVFVDLGGLEGLIHVSELSWGRVSHPSCVLKVNQPIDALVLTITEETGRVALSLKRLQPNPWDVLIKNYQTGDIVPANITAIQRYGAFARLKEGVEGLIHVSTIHLPAGRKDLDSYLTVGQRVQVRILHIDAERRRLGLGLVSPE